MKRDKSPHFFALDSHITTLKQWGRTKDFKFSSCLHLDNWYQCGCGYTLALYVNVHFMLTKG